MASESSYHALARRLASVLHYSEGYARELAHQPLQSAWGRLRLP